MIETVYLHFEDLLAIRFFAKQCKRSYEHHLTTLGDDDRADRERMSRQIDRADRVMSLVHDMVNAYQNSDSSKVNMRMTIIEEPEAKA